jgi:hypothetical protein
MTTTPEQIEAVARAIAFAEGYFTPDDEIIRSFEDSAIDAIDTMRPFIRAEALEEAAKVVTEHYQELCTEHRLLLVNRAAAIRALKETRND